MADPEYAEVILVEYKTRPRFRQWNMPLDLPGPAVEFLQACQGRNPEPAFLIFPGVGDVIVTEAGSVARNAGIMTNFPGCGIQAKQALGRSRQPQYSRPVLADLSYRRDR